MATLECLSKQLLESQCKTNSEIYDLIAFYIQFSVFNDVTTLHPLGANHISITCLVIVVQSHIRLAFPGRSWKSNSLKDSAFRLPGFLMILL